MNARTRVGDVGGMFCGIRARDGNTYIEACENGVQNDINRRGWSRALFYRRIFHQLAGGFESKRTMCWKTGNAADPWEWMEKKPMWMPRIQRRSSGATLQTRSPSAWMPTDLEA